MTRWLTVLQDGGFSWTYNRDREDAPETLRSFAGDRDTALTNESVTLSMEARLSYEEAAWWYRLGIGGAASVLTGASDSETPPAYTYAIDPDPTQDLLASATLKYGTGTLAYVFRRFMVNTMTLRCNPNAGGEATWRIVAEGPAIFVGTDTFDSPSDITRTMVLANGSKMYFDTGSDAIGDTEVENLVRNFSITVANNIEEKRFINSGAAAGDDVGRGLQRVTGDFTMEFMDDTHFAIMRANTAAKLRFEQTGAEINAAGPANYLNQIDIPQAKLNAPSLSWTGQNHTATFPFIGEKGASTQAIETTVVHAGSSVAA